MSHEQGTKLVHPNGEKKSHGVADELDWDMDMVEDDPLEEANHLESTFYKEGYESGAAHGRLHGLFEGRELGREKAWELWEEVGYYEGWAQAWVGVLEKKVAKGSSGSGRGKDARALSHAQTLLELIKSFPTTNPSAAITQSDPSATSDASAVPPGSTSGTAPPDLATLLSNIRARYRLLCSSLNVRPRLAGAVIVEANPGSGAAAASAASASEGTAAAPAGGQGGAAEGVVEGIEGPMKGVDTRQLRF
ncbi:hypothetical protein IAT38_003637 [Cryptococcus sp. DSM 104549]